MEHTASFSGVTDSGDRRTERAAWRFLEFFTVNIRNKNTRAAYGQAADAFLRWCEAKGITCIQDVRPVHVAGYIEQLQATRSVPSHYPVRDRQL